MFTVLACVSLSFTWKLERRDNRTYVYLLWRRLVAVIRSREAWEGFEDDFRSFLVEKRLESEDGWSTIRRFFY